MSVGLKKLNLSVGKIKKNGNEWRKLGEGTLICIGVDDA